MMKTAKPLILISLAIEGQTILDLPNYAITTEDIMSAQAGISQG